MTGAGSTGIELTGDALGRGAVMGAVSFVLGYLATFVLVGNQAGETFSEIPSWKVVAYYFFSGHLAEIRNESLLVQFLENDGGDLIAATAGAESNLLYLVPPLAIVVGGVFLARQFQAGGDVTDGALAGAFTLIGYLPMVFVVAVLSSHTVEADIPFLDISVTFEPVVGGTVLLAGIFYPLVFGALGGVIGSVLESS